MCFFNKISLFIFIFWKNTKTSIILLIKLFRNVRTFIPVFTFFALFSLEKMVVYVGFYSVDVNMDTLIVIIELYAGINIQPSVVAYIKRAYRLQDCKYLIRFANSQLFNQLELLIDLHGSITSSFQSLNCEQYLSRAKHSGILSTLRPANLHRRRSIKTCVFFVLIANVSNHYSDKPTHPRCLASAFAAHTEK